MFLHDDRRLPLAWAPWFSHEYINYYAVQALPVLMALPPVPVRQDSGPDDEAWPPGPNHVDLYRERYTDARRLDPLRSFDYAAKNGDFSREAPLHAIIEPWKVLVGYSTEPDLNLDCDLVLDKRQKLTGGSHGWRHMEFRVFGMKIGIVRESLRHHRDRARKAFNDGNDYWGWRYLSRCTHYLADMGNPFHVKALPAMYLLRHIASARDLFTTVSAVHKSYELYVERRFREGFAPFGNALARGAAEGMRSGTGDERALAGYTGRAAKRLDPIFNFFLNSYGSGLVDVFRHGGSAGREDASFLVSRCAVEASRIIFSGSGSSALADLDGITADILRDVGAMLGALLSGFSGERAVAREGAFRRSL
ncbi:MAG TPA: hypothetical protein PLM53_18430 [Spirochaetota bacterium]|nr:hypothetical protein [Spirochaetota bacterium]HPC42640.1 hypothetical protein [Spirochaetota bacterium]HPL16265.1 hypothetical protein [Spirochaetota bacterium]HQF08440.1 hypothetical protein [Spirochaetota bacterium]HQH99078.1 hypothetical protein [Spirochaetota bacterium]